MTFERTWITLRIVTPTYSVTGVGDPVSIGLKKTFSVLLVIKPKPQ